MTGSEQPQEEGCHSDQDTTDKDHTATLKCVRGRAHPRTHLLPQLVDNDRGILWETMVKSLFCNSW